MTQKGGNDEWSNCLQLKQIWIREREYGFDKLQLNRVNQSLPSFQISFFFKISLAAIVLNYNANFVIV